MDRRTFIGGSMTSGASLAMPALAASKATRTFRIMRDGDDIGSHSLEAVLGPSGLEVAITIRIAVKFLGITAYRYEMDNREIWKSGRIVSVDSRVNDDGTDDNANIVANGDVLSISGSRYKGTAPGTAVTTSYFAPPFLERQPWLSTQSGAPLPVQIAPEGRNGWYAVTGELETKLGYDSRGEWTGCEFDAGGELATYAIASENGRIGGLWAEA